MLSLLVAAAASAAVAPPSARRAVRAQMLERINAARAVHGLAPVALDAEMSAKADAHCERQLRERTVGHFTLDGFPPYARYSQAGANDAIAENAVAWSTKYPITSASLLDLARRSHDAMVAERPPHDSHRRAILDPHATHVALGAAWSGRELRIVQIFLRRHIAWSDPPPRHVRFGERLAAAGRPLGEWKVVRASFHHEPIPEPLSAEAANRIETYALPPATWQLRPSPPVAASAHISLGEWAAAARHRGELAVAADGSFSITAPLTEPGVYTLVVWLERPGMDEPVAASHIATIVGEAGVTSAASLTSVR